MLTYWCWPYLDITFVYEGDMFLYSKENIALCIKNVRYNLVITHKKFHWNICPRGHEFGNGKNDIIILYLSVFNGENYTIRFKQSIWLYEQFILTIHYNHH